MDAHTIGVLLLGGLGLGLVVWVLHKIGKALITMFEALAAMAVVFLALWWLLKALVWLFTQVVTYWRTSLTLLALTAWWRWWGWLSLVLTLSVITLLLALWRWADLVSFDTWAGRWLRAWWLRWIIYSRKLPDWLHACGLSITDGATPMVTVKLVGRNKIRRHRHPSNSRVPKILRVRSGASWDEVRIRLVPGQKPEDFDTATRALASARGVARCQIRELKPDVVSIDFQRRNLLTGAVPCPELTTLAGVAGGSVELRRVWAGRTEYGQDWFVPLTGSAASHTLTAGASGAGKNSVMWCPLVSIAPAIRDGLVRVSGIDPKGFITADRGTVLSLPVGPQGGAAA
jgi:S-DNA-T family DNA segregation ATPase FtsK/SpoIIIE